MQRRGHLRIYLGAAPGVGKTYAMLAEGWRRRSRGADVVVGYVETHDRPNTVAQLRDLPIVPRRQIRYHGQALEEMDVDAILARRPQVALVDELAHTNIPGSKNEKRWQDIEELLASGIDVISTVNIQHLATLNDIVERITGVGQRETVPDAVVRAADQIELVDMSPEALRRRMAHGNVYPPNQVDTALAFYFRVGNLAALRELALLWVADRVDDELADYRERHGIRQPWETKERIVVALSGAPGSEHLLRRAFRMAARTSAEVIGVHVRVTDGRARDEPPALEDQRRLVGELGGRFVEVGGVDEAKGLVRFAKTENATQLLLGASRRSWAYELLHGSVINRVVRDAAPIDVHVISAPDAPSPPVPQLARRHRPALVPARRRNAALVLAILGVPLLAFGISPIHQQLGLPGALLVLLLAVTCVATLGGVVAGVAAAVTGALFGDFFFAPPLDSFRVDHPVEAVALVVFFAVAGIVSALVDSLTRRGVQVARAQAESESLARLAGASVLAGAQALPDIVADVRRTFGLDSAAILTRREGGWTAAVAEGAPAPSSPEEGSYAVELDGGASLVLSGHTLSADDVRLLDAFVAQLRTAQTRERLEVEAKAAVELAEANTLRSALLAAVSHDLRTPLASIKAAVTSILSKEVAWEPEQVRQFCETIDSEADRLNDLIASLLDMTRLQSGMLPVVEEPTSVHDVLDNAIASLASAATGVVVHFNGDVPPASADPGLLERAVANLVSNAQKWAPPGKPARVEVGAVDGEVEIRVIDEGPGIPVARRESVFVPFQQLGDGVGQGPQGLGLGLALAKGFVEAMSGRLAIEDTPGGGTTMVVTLKRSAEGS